MTKEKSIETVVGNMQKYSNSIETVVWNMPEYGNPAKNVVWNMPEYGYSVFNGRMEYGRIQKFS